MIRRLSLLFFVALASTARAQDSVPRLEVAYEVDVSDPSTGSARVTMKILHNTADEVDVSIPCWSPGSYRVQNHFRLVKNVASPGGVRKLDEMTWRVQAQGSTVPVTYEVEVPKDRLDADHFFFEGPTLYFYVVSHKDAPSRVAFRLPEGWKVGTGLEARDGFFVARDYDTFIDCPTELGKFDLHEFRQDGARYQIVVHSIDKYDGPGLVEICRKVVKEQNAMFGGPPFDRYVFLFHFKKTMGGGGLEHLNSTNITLGYDWIKNDIGNAASITSHEYFHLWNVKRIRPKELGPFDYTGVVRSRHLWLCEGVTSYFGDRALARASLWDESRYLQHLANEIETHNNNSDRLVTSVERASERVWDRQDWPRVDYYNKGECLGMLLDLRIRTLTENQKSFDDVMRSLLDDYVVNPSKNGAGPIGVGFESNGILKAIHSVSGHDFTDFYKSYVQGVKDLPFEEVLTEAGLEVTLTVRKAPDLGIPLRGTTVAHVVEGGFVEKAGLRAGDRLMKINGIGVTRENLRAETEKLKTGDKAKLTFVRGEETVEVAWTVAASEKWRCTLARRRHPTEIQDKIIDSWLGK